MGNERHDLRRSLGKRIQQLRRRRGFTQEQLAEGIDRTSKHVGQVERGEVNVGIDSLIGIARKLAVHVKDLFPDGRSGVHVITDQDLKTLAHVAKVVERIGAESHRAPPAAASAAQKPRRTP